MRAGLRRSQSLVQRHLLATSQSALQVAPKSRRLCSAPVTRNPSMQRVETPQLTIGTASSAALLQPSPGSLMAAVRRMQSFSDDFRDDSSASGTAVLLGENRRSHVAGHKSAKTEAAQHGSSNSAAGKQDIAGASSGNSEERAVPDGAKESHKEREQEEESSNDEGPHPELVVAGEACQMASALNPENHKETHEDQDMVSSIKTQLSDEKEDGEISEKDPQQTSTLSEEEHAENSSERNELQADDELESGNKENESSDNNNSSQTLGNQSSSCISDSVDGQTRMTSRGADTAMDNIQTDSPAVLQTHTSTLTGEQSNVSQSPLHGCDESDSLQVDDHAVVGVSGDTNFNDTGNVAETIRRSLEACCSATKPELQTSLHLSHADVLNADDRDVTNSAIADVICISDEDHESVSRPRSSSSLKEYMNQKEEPSEAPTTTVVPLKNADEVVMKNGTPLDNEPASSYLPEELKKESDYQSMINCSIPDLLRDTIVSESSVPASLSLCAGSSLGRNSSIQMKYVDGTVPQLNLQTDMTQNTDDAVDGGDDERQSDVESAKHVDKFVLEQGGYISSGPEQSISRGSEYGHDVKIDQEIMLLSEPSKIQQPATDEDQSAISPERTHPRRTHEEDSDDGIRELTENLTSLAGHKSSEGEWGSVSQAVSFFEKSACLNDVVKRGFVNLQRSLSSDQSAKPEGVTDQEEEAEPSDRVQVMQECFDELDRKRGGSGTAAERYRDLLARRRGTAEADEQPLEPGQTASEVDAGKELEKVEKRASSDLSSVGSDPKTHKKKKRGKRWYRGFVKVFSCCLSSQTSDSTDDGSVMNPSLK